jgi:hypothetical protein
MNEAIKPNFKGSIIMKYLMNIHTGSVDTEENWEAETLSDESWALYEEMKDYDELTETPQEEFDNLIEVTKDKDGEWVEVTSWNDDFKWKDKFYGFEYASGKNTTSGPPNEKTGNMNKAGKLVVFTKKENREEWADETGRSTQKIREAVSIKKARELHLGMSVADFDEMLDYMEPFDAG